MVVREPFGPIVYQNPLRPMLTEAPRLPRFSLTPGMIFKLRRKRKKPMRVRIAFLPHGLHLNSSPNEIGPRMTEALGRRIDLRVKLRNPALCQSAEGRKRLRSLFKIGD